MWNTRRSAPVPVPSLMASRFRSSLPALHNGQREVECRAIARLRFHPDAATIPLHHALADRQADTRAGNSLAMQPFEHTENGLVILRLNPHSVILHGKLPFGFTPGRRDMNARRLHAAVFDGIADQILE